MTSKTRCDIGAARSYGYTSFDMPASVNGASFGYAPEHARASYASSGATLYYYGNPAGGTAGEMVAGTSPAWRTYLAPYGHIAAEFFGSGPSQTAHYFVEDHEGSTTALTDASGALDEYDSFDAWGKRRNASGSDAGGCFSLHPVNSLTLRGYTGQEMMDNLCLVNLNARLYDPALGRVISADPVVADPANGQSYNRYSYVDNRPLSATDPSGYVTCIICDGMKIVSDGGGGGVDGSLGGSGSGGCSIWPGCVGDSSPVYNDTFFLPFGGWVGFGGGSGFGGGGSAQHIGCVGGCPQTQLAENGTSDIPVLENVLVWGPPTGDFSNGDFSWDTPWANAGFLGWNGFPGGGYVRDEPVGHGGEGVIFNIGLAVATFGASIPEQLTTEGGADLAAASWDAAATEAEAEGVPYTSFTNTTADGAADNITNFDINISAGEAEDNLLANGYQVSPTTTSSGGTVLTNGTNTYSFYTRSSNASGMQFDPGTGWLLKFNFF